MNSIYCKNIKTYARKANTNWSSLWKHNNVHMDVLLFEMSLVGEVEVRSMDCKM